MNHAARATVDVVSTCIVKALRSLHGEYCKRSQVLLLLRGLRTTTRRDMSGSVAADLRTTRSHWADQTTHTTLWFS
jgi:hypothetical protein